MSDAAHSISAKPAVVADFNWEDPLDLEGQLTEEERMIRDSVREFADDKLATRVKSAFRDERFDREIMTEAGELGLMGIMTDPAYGGQGLGYVAYGLIAREIERVDFRLSLGHFSAELARHAPDRGLWLRGPEEEIPAQAGHRRNGRLLRPDRA